MKVCILWHMHQPDYRLPGQGGRAAMPWVRLHAAKDYMDMARLAEEAPANVRVTFNLTPCLLDQLHDLAEGRHQDELLDIARKDARDLSESERIFALQHFFSVHEERQIRPSPRYAELRDRKRRAKGKILEHFSDADLRDLTVLFHLAWSGQWLRREPAVQHLLAKGRGFTEGDKKVLLDAQDRQARAIFPLYGALARAGKIEVSTTPLYHPILPLLVDLRAAQEARAGCSVGGIEFRYPEDARTHVQEGLDRTEKFLGWRPRGMWPSEGSLSEGALDVLAEAGLAWCATDEQNLKKSLRDPPPACHLRPYRVRGRGPAIFFRDTGLSDLIGFTYARWDAERAAEDFVGKCLDTGRAYTGPGEPVLPVILDGENAWETYPENGEVFLRALYERLGATPGVETTTFTRALETAPVGELSHLAPGSWIYGNFDTWAGHEEKNRAWSLLSAVRREVQDAGGPAKLPNDGREVLLRAEGSDWFWWLGDDHPTAYLSEFESLFRANLQFVCKRLGRAAPSGLDEPIPRRRQVAVAIEEPIALIAPRLDGEASRYYEWVGSGAYRPENEGAAMKVGQEPLVAEMRFGFDERRFYLRFDPRRKSGASLRGCAVKLTFEGTAVAKATFVWRDGEGLSAPQGDLAPGAEAACGKVLEVALPRGAIGLHAFERARLTIEITGADQRRELIPRDGAIELAGPDEHFDLRNWTL